MMYKLYLLVLLSLGHVTFCNSQSETTNLINTEVPKFLRALKNLPHDNMGLAFIKMNEVLKYKVSDIPASKGTLEATSPIKDKKMAIDGQMNLLAVPLDSGYSLTLLLYPQGPNGLLEAKVSKMLINFQKMKVDELPTWEVYGWKLQVKDNNVIRYQPFKN